MANARQSAKAAIPSKPTELNKDIADEKEARERALDKTIAETFPASDPLSSDPNPAPDEEEKDRLAS